MDKWWHKSIASSPDALISFTSPCCTEDAKALIEQAASRQSEELGMSNATGKATHEEREPRLGNALAWGFSFSLPV